MRLFASRQTVEVFILSCLYLNFLAERMQLRKLESWSGTSGCGVQSKTSEVQITREVRHDLAQFATEFNLLDNSLLDAQKSTILLFIRNRSHFCSYRAHPEIFVVQNQFIL